MPISRNAHIKYIVAGALFAVLWPIAASIGVDKNNGYDEPLGVIPGAFLALAVVLVGWLAMEIIRTMWEGWKIHGQGWQWVIFIGLIIPPVTSFALCYLFVTGFHERRRMHAQRQRVNATLRPATRA